MKGKAVIAFDIRFQFRHGFYYAYLFVSAVYILFLWFIPPELKQPLAVIMVFSDPGVMGFFFVGGILLLERGQGVLDNLFITPLEPWEFIFSKCISLAFLALSTSLAILLFTFGFAFNPLPLALGVVLTSFISTLAGLALAAKASSLNGYLISSPLFQVPFTLPLIDYVGLLPSSLFYLLPGKASLVLIDASFGGRSGGELALAALSLAAWTGATYFWARRIFYRHLILKSGGAVK